MLGECRHCQISIYWLRCSFQLEGHRIQAASFFVMNVYQFPVFPKTRLSLTWSTCSRYGCFRPMSNGVTTGKTSAEKPHHDDKFSGTSIFTAPFVHARPLGRLICSLRCDRAEFGLPVRREIQRHREKGVGKGSRVSECHGRVLQRCRIQVRHRALNGSEYRT